MILDDAERGWAIKDRLAAATPGPWGVYNLSNGLWIRNTDTKQTVCYPGPDACLLPRTDVEFIAHAREDVAMLVDEVERLQAIVDRSSNDS